MIIKNSELEKMMKQAYAKMPLLSKRAKTPNLKWPRDIEVTEEMGKITLHINENAIQSNMQSNVSAFEGWLLVLKELVCKDYRFSVEFRQGDKTDKHYQRFLFRLSLFDSLYGRGSDDPWFKLNQPIRAFLKSDCRYILYRDQDKLICNIGKGGRGNGKVNDAATLSALGESELEWRLCKDGADRECLKNVFNTGIIYRQFPVGIFYGEPPSDANALFPGKKACVDLVADGNDKKSFWIFELKKKGNIPLGILSELLFYAAIVRDMVAGRIKTQRPSDNDCYDSTNLDGKEIINACFLAPDFHPLLIEPIIDNLNNAFAQLKKRDSMCTVVFHKSIIDMDKTGKLFII